MVSSSTPTYQELTGDRSGSKSFGSGPRQRREPVAAVALMGRRSSKAALHSYALSQRYKLRGSNVRVLEIVPPYVQTELAGTQQATDPRAMPLAEFIAETMTLMAREVDEVLVQRVNKLRSNPGPNEYPFVEEFNRMMAGH